MVCMLPDKNCQVFDINYSVSDGIRFVQAMEKIERGGYAINNSN
jgi:hypothetical protein